MPLTAGARLGPYQVLGALGAGGMGEVYRARDTRLGRTVALKILPPDIASDPASRERLGQEARAISSLAHPHICTLFDIGHQEGTDFLVMELLEGETLSDRLSRGPLPIAEAGIVAAQIAGALAAAHERGIVHRDLKPANVMLTKSGAKLLDFGIARASRTGFDDTIAATATMIAAVDAGGRVLGTLPYMAPEVLEGREADARSDIFAFGAVLFEMIAGVRAFDSGTGAGTIAAILATQRPSLQAVRPHVPAALDRLLASCLSRDPAARWQSAHDIALYLGAMADLAPTAAPPRTRAIAPLVAAGVLLGTVAGALGGVIWTRASARSPATPATHLSLALASGTLLSPNDSPAGGSNVALSPDGRTVAVIAAHRGSRALVIQSLDTGQAKTLPGTQDAMSPVFSPDGRWIAFFTESDLRKVSLDDGTMVTVCATPPVPRGAAWADDGSVYFSPDFSRGLQRVSAAGGHPTDVTKVRFEDGESNHLLPEVLPRSQSVLFTVWKGGSFKDATVWAQSLRSGERKQLLDAATAPRYVAPGYLAFAREGVLFAVPFDPVRVQLTGEPFPVVNGVWTDPANGTAHYAVGPNGTLVFAPGRNTVEQRQLVWVGRDGRVTPTGVDPGVYGNFRLSPDGTRVAIELLNDIWMYDFRTGAMNRLTYRAVNQFPVWTPDGRRIAISSSQNVLWPALFWLPADGGQPPERIGREDTVQFPGSWTPDGRRLVYADLRTGPTMAGRPESVDTGWDVRVIEASAGAASVPIVATSFMEDSPMISPDGKALAYASMETGRREVYVRPFPGQGTRVRVSIGGGTEPVWSRGGGELYFRNEDKYFAAKVTTAGAVAAGPPIELFTGDFVVSSLTPATPSYDVAPDGRFLMVGRAGEQALPSRVEIVLNWVSDLTARAARR